jgi:hypothetical protein
LNNALACIAKVDPPKTLTDPTYEEHYTNLEKTANGFFSCLIAETIETVPENGFCGPGTAEDNQVRLTCAEGLCCGRGIFEDSPEETAVYSCQKQDQTWYKPLNMAGYE